MGIHSLKLKRWYKNDTEMNRIINEIVILRPKYQYRKITDEMYISVCS